MYVRPLPDSYGAVRGRLLFAERATTMPSAFSSWRGYAALCGWDVPDEKSPPPKDVFRTIGAMTDVSRYPGGPVVLRAIADRVERTNDDLTGILRDGRLQSGFAGKLYGRLQWASSCYFGRLGRAMLRPFSRRQHETDRSALNPQIIAACRFWLSNIQKMRPREVPIDVDTRPLAISYSNGEGDTAGVGIALWLPDGTVRAGYLKVPDEVRQLWSKRPAGDRYDIYEIEAIGPLLVLWNWGFLMRNHVWIHFIDNDAALSCLAKGSSSVLSGEVIVAYTHELAADLGVWSWYDRVDTGSNPVDGLSRGDMRGNWKLLRIRFPAELTRRLQTFLCDT